MAKSLDLVTFGETMLIYKPAPPAATGDTPLTTGASMVVQAVGGAEMNTAVAATQVGTKTKWVSVLPDGPLGKIVVDAAAATGLELAAPYVRFEQGATIGTLHVVDDGSGPRPHYQRKHSAFCSMLDGSTFDWPALLKPAKWLHVTGITPPLGAGPLGAWQAAIRAAKAAGTLVSLDLNWRPALGPLDELWAVVEPELPHVRLLILSEADLVRLGTKAGLYPTEGGAPTPPASLGPDALCEVLLALRRRWALPMVACTFKRPLAAAAAAAAAEGQLTNTIKAGGNRRFSAVAAEAGCVCTADMGVEHHPVQALGGGDAWVAGFLGHLAQHPAPSAGELKLGLRRGDLLAALAQETHGDFSSVSHAQLAEATERWHGETAVLPPPGGAAAAAGGGKRMTQAEVMAAMGEARLVPVVVVPEAAAAAELGAALLEGGVRVVEIVFRTAAAGQMVASAPPHPGCGRRATHAREGRAQSSGRSHAPRSAAWAAWELGVAPAARLRPPQS